MKEKSIGLTPLRVRTLQNLLKSNHRSNKNAHNFEKFSFFFYPLFQISIGEYFFPKSLHFLHISVAFWGCSFVDLNQKFQHFEPYRVFAGFFAKIGHFGPGDQNRSKLTKIDKNRQKTSKKNDFWTIFSEILKELQQKRQHKNVFQDKILFLTGRKNIFE